MALTLSTRIRVTLAELEKIRSQAGIGARYSNGHAHAGFHRAPSLPGLLIAATAEPHRLTVLHYDGDFDMIGSITGQPTQWVVPPGAADR
ncbi:hypothetical protein GCM10023084_04360 [Streptomyces lacrimifluminis]|uniref:Uncharacterized protein n=1 Tax=Streptomyces lacrimifluminis TaxID=1500077 RepID=A0A917KPP7_9ACTN|nr:hypothetical protein GCM10012282_18100 [Streptomyces lacrimifluminis]